MTTHLAGAVLAASRSAALMLALKSTAVLAFGLLVVLSMRRARAARRHAVLALGLGGVLLLPILTAVMPPLVVVVARPQRSDVLERGGSDRVETATAGPQDGAGRAPARASFPAARVIVRVLVLVWGAGAAAALLCLAVGVRSVRRQRREAVAWPLACKSAGVHVTIGARVEVRRHHGVVVPVTFGVVKPTVLLPADAEAWPRPELRRALLHELAHVARRDWITHAAAGLACACYWWNPLAWIAWRRLQLEAERASDDVVVAAGEPVEYAQQLLTLARRVSRAPSLVALSMARSTDLSARVSAVLDVRQRRGKAGHRFLAVSLLATVAALAVASSLRAESPAFEAAVLRRDRTREVPFPEDPGARVGQQTGGVCASLGPIRLSDTCLTATALTPRELVWYAFAPDGLLPPRPPIAGAPTWFDDDRYDLVALAGGLVPLEAASRSSLAAMTRALLQERMTLAAHWEARDAPILALRVSPGGARLRPARADCAALAVSKTCATVSGRGFVRGPAMRMAQLVFAVGNRLGRPVRDETGLAGRYDVSLVWGSDGKTLSQAIQDDLGIVLVPVVGPVETLVIDRISRPVAD
jgi:uncharacterized protein (TIGR03435 family)